MFFNILKHNTNTDGDRSKNEGAIALHALLFTLIKTDPNKNPASYHDDIGRLKNFLQTDKRAPNPSNPFLSEGSLGKIATLVKQGKLAPEYFQPEHPLLLTNDPQINWGKGLGSLILTAARNKTAAEMHDAAAHFYIHGHPSIAKLEQTCRKIAKPFQELLQKYIPATHLIKQTSALDQQSARALNEQIVHLQQTGASLNVERSIIDRIQQQVVSIQAHILNNKPYTTALDSVAAQPQYSQNNRISSHPAHPPENAERTDFFFHAQGNNFTIPGPRSTAINFLIAAHLEQTLARIETPQQSQAPGEQISARQKFCRIELGLNAYLGNYLRILRSPNQAVPAAAHGSIPAMDNDNNRPKQGDTKAAQTDPGQKRLPSVNM